MGVNSSVKIMEISPINDTYDPIVNGLLLNGKLIPEPVLEIILSCVNVRDILKLRKVCRLWRDTVSRRTFWKFVFERNEAQWDIIPSHIKERQDCWVALHWLLTHKDLVKNHSGHDGFKNWKKLESFNNTFIIESPPVGINSLPPKTYYHEKVDSAFVTSYSWIELHQKICLPPKLMDLLVPFDFVCKLMVGARFDCGGEYSIGLQLTNGQGEYLTRNEVSGVIQAGTDWTEISCSLNVTAQYPAKYLTVSIRGKDNQFWAGHYGTKFSRISVAVKCWD